MKLSPNLLAAALLLASASHAFSAVSDDTITADAKEYQRLFSQAREAGDRPGMADMGDYLDKAFANVPINDLTLDQIDHMLNTLPFRFSTKTAAALRTDLATLSQGTTADAARAAFLQIDLLPTTTKPDDLVAPITALLAHPGTPKAIAKGYGSELFEAASELKPDKLLAQRDALVALKDSITPAAGVPFFQQTAGFFMAIPRTLDPKDVTAFSPLREAVASALDEKLKGTVDEKIRPRLESIRDQLHGAFARGEFVGHKAPAIEFTWFKDPANPTKTIHSLDDLKGKVVILDFWATWCGPCVASFPKVKALAHYYRGYDVVVLSVTSLQGFVMSSKGRVDTKDDAAKEYALTDDFLKEHDVTWPVAFSKQPVFNPDYGVMGIPDVVMIDPDGIVRHAGLHPAVPLEEKTALVDKLLGDAHLIIPASLVEMKKPDPANPK